MSTKNNALIGAAAAALGMTVTPGLGAICDGMLNDAVVTGFGAAEVDAAGRVLVLVEITNGATVTVRPVADSLGNVRLYPDGNAAIALSKRTNVASGVEIKFVKLDKVATVGDPVNALKARFKKFKNEAAASLKQHNTVTAKQSAAVALGWDTAVGTPENLEYLDIVARLAAIDEWKAYNDAQVTSMAAALTAAGIDPLTVV